MDTFHAVFSPNVEKYEPEITPYLDTFHAGSLNPFTIHWSGHPEAVSFSFKLLLVRFSISNWYFFFMSISSNLNSPQSVKIISTDFSGKNCSTKKLISFFPYTQNESDDDIGSHLISKNPSDSRILHVFWGNLASILLHIDFAYFSTKFVIWISSDSFKTVLSSFNLPFRSSLSCWMNL